MSSQKHYMDIVRLGHKTTAGVLNEGDQVVIQEKLDGANSSFKKDGNSRAILRFSRNTQLDEGNGLRGFYQWVEKKIDVDLLDPNYVYFGEWLVKHKIDYGEYMNNFYLFDVYNTVTEEYLSFQQVREWAGKLGIQTVPVFYQGEYKGFDHLMSFVGKSKLGEVGEGIVVKNASYKDKYGNQIFVKLVSDAFREVQKQKAPKDPNAPKTPEQEYAMQFVTEARTEKLLLKLVDEGVLDENFGIEDMSTILKNLNQRVYEDLLKEESDSLPDPCDEKQLRKSIGYLIANQVRKIIGRK